MLTTIICLICAFFIMVFALSAKAQCKPPLTDHPCVYARIRLEDAKLCINCNTVFPIEGRCICGSTKSHSLLKSWLDYNPSIEDVKEV